MGSSYRLSGGKTYDVSRVFLHEAYDPDYLLNDIAILMTSSRINFSSSVKPITVAPPNIYLPSGTEALVSGFGLTEVSEFIVFSIHFLAFIFISYVA